MKEILRLIVVSTLFISILFNCFETCSASGDTIDVFPGDSIQNAINNANVSDNIYIHSGTYYENIVIDKTINLIGDSYQTTSIYSEFSNIDVIKISLSNNVEISGLTITQNQSSESSGIYVYYSDYCTISQCSIKKMSTGLYVKKSHSNTFNNNIIQECNYAGIIISGSNSNTITNNNIKNNEKGIYVSDSNCASNNIYYNDFYYNDQNAYESGSNNWDDGSEGNKWSDYTGSNSGDGTGTIPYNVPGGGTDNEPTGYFVNQKPTAYIVSISPSNPTEQDTVYFTGGGTDDGYIIRYEWKIDGGSPMSGGTIEYSGFSPGTHTVSLRVMDNEDEWSDWTSDSFTVTSVEPDETNQKPVANIIVPESKTVYFGDTITFSGSGTDPDPDGNVVGYEWSSNRSGIISTDNYFFKSDLTVGSHKINFRVRDDKDEWSTPVSVTIMVLSNSPDTNVPPVADSGGPYNAYANNNINLDGSASYDSDGTIVSYIWHFGDGSTGSGKYVNHIYSNEGNYTVVLTVTDNEGSINTNTSIATILAQSGSNTNGDADENGGGTIPGFEIVVTLAAIVIIGLAIKFKK